MSEKTNAYTDIPETPIHTALQIIFGGEEALHEENLSGLCLLAKRLRVTNSKWYTELMHRFPKMETDDPMTARILKEEQVRQLRNRLATGIGNEAINSIAGELSRIPMLSLRDNLRRFPEPGTIVTDTDEDADDHAEEECPDCGEGPCGCLPDPKDVCKLCGVWPCICDNDPNDEE